MKKMLFILIVMATIIFSISLSYAGFGTKLEFGGANEYAKAKSIYSCPTYFCMFVNVFANYKFGFLSANHQIYGNFQSWVSEDFHNTFQKVYILGYKISYDLIYIDIQHLRNYGNYNLYYGNCISEGTSGNTNQNWLSNQWGEQMTTVAIGFKFGDID